MPSEHQEQSSRRLLPIDVPMSGQSEWLLLRAPDELSPAGLHDLSDIIDALDYATAMAEKAISAASGGAMHGRATVLSYLLASLRQSLIAVLNGTSSPLFNHRHRGKAYPIKTHHPMVVRLKRRAVGVVSLLSRLGFPVLDAEEAVVDALDIAGFEGWGLEALRVHKRKLTQSGEIDAVLGEVMVALAKNGQQVSTPDEAQSIADAVNKQNNLPQVVLGRLMLEAARAAALIRSHEAKLAAKT